MIKYDFGMIIVWVGWFEMSELTSIIGERGQMVVPKIIREEDGFHSQQKVMIRRLEPGKFLVEKVISKREKERLMIKGYKEMAQLDLEIEDEWKYASKEVDAMLDD